MLQVLETAIVAQLEPMRKTLPRLELRSYGGELSDGDLLAEVLRAGHAVLVTQPRGRFTRKSNRRYAFEATVRLVIASRQPRGEVETRHGVASTPGSYALWESCMRLLTDWSPHDEAGPLQPTDYNNLINSRFQNDFLSVIGQSFTVSGHWTVPEGPIEPLSGIDLTYYLHPDDGVADATDRID